MSLHITQYQFHCFTSSSCLFQCHPLLFSECQRLRAPLRALSPALKCGPSRRTQCESSSNPCGRIHRKKEFISCGFNFFILPPLSSFPPLWIESQHREPELPPCSDFLHSNGTGEEHFLQTQGAGWCREKGGGWKSCVHMCMTLWDTTGCRSQPALLSEPALTLQGTMLTAGTKRFLHCGLPVWEGARTRATQVLQKQTDVLKCKHNCLFSWNTKGNIRGAAGKW